VTIGSRINNTIINNANQQVRQIIIRHDNIVNNSTEWNKYLIIAKKYKTIGRMAIKHN